MTEELTRALRVELDRIARAGAGFEPDPRTWARGRRARVRDRAVTVVAVAAALVCLAAIGLIARPHGQMAAPADRPHSQLGVPRTIWPVPERLVQHTSKPPGDESTWDDRVVEPDLAIGRGAVALAAGGHGELAVVITAADGRYHPLDLPGYLQAGLINSAWDGAPLALSPDGKRLAYGWWDPAAPLDRPMPAGVRIVDLEDGTIRTVALEGGNGVRVTSISWSPDSRWIGWVADRTKSWTPASSLSGADSLIAGRIDPAGVPSTLPKSLNNAIRSAMTSTGLLTLHDGPGILTWDGTHIDRHPWSDGSEAAAATAWSPSGRWLALSTRGPSERFTYAGSDGSRHSVRIPPGYTEGADLTPLGWLDDSTVVVLVDQNLMLIDLSPTPPEELTGLNVIGKVRSPAPAHLSIAVDLLTTDRTTVVRPEPQWPWSDERKVWTVVLGLLFLVLTGGLVNRWARKRSDNATPRPDGRPGGVS